MRANISLLKEHFVRMQRRFHPEMDVMVKVSELAEVFRCTPRNVRNIMKELKKLGWIEWEPSVGRGKQSRLIFTRSANEIRHESVKDFLEKGKLSEALSLIGDDVGELEKQIYKYLGAFMEGDNRIIRIPWYRSLDTLEPWKPQRRTERHLLRQCFSGLTCYDRELDRTVPDLAHHWITDDTFCIWDFYLRPGLKFSNGTHCSTTEVEKCLVSAMKSPLFSKLFRKIVSLKIIDDLHIRFELKSGNKDFPSLLSHPSMLIYGMQGGKITYTGPWSIKEHDPYHLVLKINSWYHGIRPIIDEVNILRVDTDILNMGNIPVYYQGMNNIVPVEPEKKLERGSCFLVIDSKGEYADDEDRIFR